MGHYLLEFAISNHVVVYLNSYKNHLKK